MTKEKKEEKKEQPPKGTLIAIGGNEDRGINKEPNASRESYESFLECSILRRFLDEAGGHEAHIEILICPSREDPQAVAKQYIAAFKMLGNNKVGILLARTADEISQEENLKRLQNAGGLFITGGDQLILVEHLIGTRFLEVMHQRYQHEGFVIAGTSAGAMLMPEVMIETSSSAQEFSKEELQLGHGLNLLPGVIIDTHFNTRGRFWRLSGAVASRPDCLGIGLDEDTAIVIKNGNDMEVIGAGLVILADGRNIKHYELIQKKEASSLAIAGITAHILSSGNLYKLRENTMYRIHPEVPL